MPIFYDQTIIGTRRVDFLVDDDIMIELKALTQLEDVHIAQLMNYIEAYIEAYKVKIGLLINFGAKKIEIKKSSNTVKRFDGVKTNRGIRE